MIWTSGMDICRDANEACFHRLFEGGFILEYRDEQSKELSDDGEIEPGPFRYIYVRVLSNGQEVSRSDFSLDLRDQPHLLPGNVRTDEPFRRRGLASAMYRFVELLTEQTMEDRWGSDQSPEAKALWASSKRPFGHRR
jgi:hypothetical protein